MGRQYWEAPEDGKPCANRRHAHMSLGKVSELMRDGKMEMVSGVYVDDEGVEHATWIPVARFVNARRWAPRMSAKMMVLQLIPGG
jgi:ribosomal protein L18E